jgi:4-hydroxy-4-methyl-2-oxoglutarate aldolase
MNDEVLERLADGYVAVLSDALDSLGLRGQALDPAIRPAYPGARLAGRALPIVLEATDVFQEEPYESHMQAVEAIQPGEVPVMAGAGASRAAAWGELFSCAARGRGGAGAVVDGYVRDVRQIEGLDYPTFARGYSPLDTTGRSDVVSIGEPILCGGVQVERGDYVVGDVDGVVIIPAAAIEAVLAYSGGKIRSEHGARAELLSGASVREVWEKYGAL